MLFIHILLLVVAILVSAGVFALYAVLCDIRKSLSQLNKMIDHQMEGLFGGYYEATQFNVADDLRQIARFAKDARKGFIPNLRYDDWHATEEDFERWEHAEIMEAANSKK